MKKFVYCINLLLAACCTTAVAQDDVLYNILKIEGMEPVRDGKETYYIKNVGTGLHVSYGAEYGKHCKESRAAHPFVLANNSDGTVALGSLAGWLESGGLWMDWEQTTSKWTLQPVGGEYVNQYYLVSDNGLALTSVGNSAGLLRLKELDYKASQRWIFLTEEEIRKNRMPMATADKPFDVTPLIRGAAFDLADGESVGANPDRPNEPEALKSLRPYLSKYWIGYDGYVSGYWPEEGEDFDPNLYNYCGIINGEADAYNVTYQVDLRAGTYSYSFEGFYEYVKRTQYKIGSWVLSTDISEYSQTMDATVKVANDDAITLKRYGNKDVFDNGEMAANEFRDYDNYKHRYTFTLDKDQTISIVISKGVTTSGSGNTTYPNQIFIDNFTLLYFGNEELTEEDINDDALYESYVDANIDEFIESLPEDQQEAAKEALENINADNVTSIEDYYNVLEELNNSITETETTLDEQNTEKALNGLPSINEDGTFSGSEGDASNDSIADASGLIKNGSFERRSLTGWAIDRSSDDTGVRPISNYATAGSDGSYLFNTKSEGVRLTQTATVPNGVYKMTVSLASDAGNTVTLIGNDNSHEVTLTKGTDTFEDHYIKFRVTGGTATIGVVGGNDGAHWYKADNFRLELINSMYDNLTLSETDAIFAAGNQSRTIDNWYANVTLNRTIKANKNWNTFVIPFDIPADDLEGWEVKELIGSTLNDQGGITLTFADAEDGIKAGVPYMVRNTTMTETMTVIPMQDVSVSTELKDVETDHVIFRGVYTKGYVPIGSYFISSNKFYRSVNETNRDNIKGYRAYIEPKEGSAAGARSLGYRFGSRDEIGEGTTAIDNAPLTNDSEPTVVAIYTLGGVRINDMQEGVNILQMSDGSVIKVVIK